MRVQTSDNALIPSLAQPEFQALASTSHHLEWIGLAPASLRPSDPQIRKAVDFYLDEIERVPDHKIDFFIFSSLIVPVGFAV